MTDLCKAQTKNLRNVIKTRVHARRPSHLEEVLRLTKEERAREVTEYAFDIMLTLLSSRFGKSFCICVCEIISVSLIKLVVVLGLIRISVSPTVDTIT